MHIIVVNREFKNYSVKRGTSKWKTITDRTTSRISRTTRITISRISRTKTSRISRTRRTTRKTSEKDADGTSMVPSVLAYFALFDVRNL